MRIFLVRHAQSMANVDWKENRRKPDHAIEITENGKKQALSVGEFFVNYLNNLVYFQYMKTRLWYSTYKRTRQTAEIIFNKINKEKKFKLDMKEHLLLAEQQFGLFDGLSDEERLEKFPDEEGHYRKCKAFEGKMWPKMPMGESRFEVCQRVHQAFGTFHRDKDKYKIDNLIIVGHGTTNRAFVQMWLHKPWEWMHQEPNPKNCSVRLIENGIDLGYIYEGFENE